MKFDEFMENFSKRVIAFKPGYKLQENTDIGPLTDQKTVNNAKLICGGRYLILKTLFFEHLQSSSIFGPIVPIFRLNIEKEAIQLANDTRYGLSDYLYDHNIGLIFYVAEALEYGTIGINRRGGIYR
jgi:succinate-semialdehyde dehydrogenase/glutarate-semialdehyde dehydrogenase